MDPFRIGLSIVAIAAGGAILSVALPVLVNVLLDLTPSVLILALIFWVLREMILKLLS